MITGERVEERYLRRGWGLVSDISGLKYQQEDYIMSQQKESEEEEDPVMLKIALK